MLTAKLAVVAVAAAVVAVGLRVELCKMNRRRVAVWGVRE